MGRKGNFLELIKLKYFERLKISWKQAAVILNNKYSQEFLPA